MRSRAPRGRKCDSICYGTAPLQREVRRERRLGAHRNVIVIETRSVRPLRTGKKPENSGFGNLVRDMRVYGIYYPGVELNMGSATGRNYNFYFPLVIKCTTAELHINNGT